MVSQKSVSDITVIVVDDDKEDLASMVESLEIAGIATQSATSGQAALQLLENCDPATTVIVSDIQMPNMDGLELCMRVRNDSRYAAIPFLVSTGLSRKLRAASKTGVAGYLAKPETPDTIGERIMNIRADWLAGAEERQPAKKSGSIFKRIFSR